MRVFNNSSKYLKSYNKLQRAHHVTERVVRNNNNTDRKTKPSVFGIEVKAERKRRVGITGSSKTAQKYEITNRKKTKPGELGRGTVLLTRATWHELVQIWCEKSVRFNKWFARAGDAGRLGGPRGGKARPPVPRAASPACLRASRLCACGTSLYTLHCARCACVCAFPVRTRLRAPVRVPPSVWVYDAPMGLAHRWARADL